MIKAVIIDDEPLARSIIAEYLQSYPDIAISAECNDGFEGLKAIAQHGPFILSGEPKLMMLMDKLLEAFVAQGRMKLPGCKYIPCY